MKLHLWKDLLWTNRGSQAIAYCPEHRIKLEVNTLWGIQNQETAMAQLPKYVYEFSCPIDDKTFAIEGKAMRVASQRFFSTLESISLKDAEIVSIDGYQIPISKAKTPEKDKDYWVEARINDTKRGKQIVVYAGKRGGDDKAQIFIDVENDKISFDQNNIHPNDLFLRLTGEFKSGKKVTLEDSSESS